MLNWREQMPALAERSQRSRKAEMTDIRNEVIRRD